MADEKVQGSAETTRKFPFLKALLSRWLIIVLITVVVTVAGTLYAFAKVKTVYTAESNVILSITLGNDSSNKNTYDVSVARAFVPSVAEIINSQKVSDVATEIYRSQDFQTAKGINDANGRISVGNIRVRHSQYNLILKISITDKDPVLVQRKLDALILAADKVTHESETIPGISKNLIATQNSYAITTSSERPQVIFMAFLLGVGISLVIVFLIYALDNKVREKDIEEILGASPIANLRK